MIEEKTMKEMKDTLTKLQAFLRCDVSTCASLRDELKELQDAIQDIIDKSKVELSFVASIKCQEKIKQSEAYQKKNFDQMRASITFQPNSDIEQYLSKLSGLGRIVQENPDQLIRLNGKFEYDVSIPSDSCKCYITAICVLPDRLVLVADNKISTVKLLDQQYRVVNHCDVSAWSQDICQIAPSEVVVTVDDFGNTHEVQFIKVINNQLVTDRKLKLQHTCRGSSHHQGDLFVTSSTALYKYTLSGNLVCKLHEDTSDITTVSRCAMSPTGDKLYVINRSQHQLLTLASDGSVIAIFTDPELIFPTSVHVTPACQVLVCGQQSSTILQVHSKGSRKLATLATRRDGLQIPASVCYNGNNGSIIVGLDGNKKILVYKLK